ncbi:MAG: hypothetical protein AAFO70_07145 [Pseudomonadota bacterium]
MKLAITSFLVTSFFASTAMACMGMKSADTKTMTTAKVEVTEEAVSTFDPTATPVFETLETPAKTDEKKLDEAAE